MSPAHPDSLPRRFLDLPTADQRRLLEAWGRLLAAAFRLRLLPRHTLARALRGPAAPGEPADGGVVASLSLAVGRAAAHHLRPMTCLPRALALQKMLARRGISAALRIGVRKEAGTLAAHAWIEVGGQAVGEPEAVEARFRALLPMDGESGTAKGR